MEKVDLVLFMGQSNMAGRGITSVAFPEEAPVSIPFSAYEYRAVTAPGELSVMKEPFGAMENREDGINDVFKGGEIAKTGSMVTSFCNAYFSIARVPIVGVSASKGGSSILQWQIDSKEQYLKDAMDRYERALNFLKENNINVRRKFVVFCQGETDGDNKLPKEKYVFFFEQMWSHLKSLVDDLFIIKTGQCNIDGEYNRYDGIREAQDVIIALNKEIHLASDLFYSMREKGLMKDAFHYYQKAYNRCGADAGSNIATHHKELV